MTKQFLAPDDVQGASLFIGGIYDRRLDLKRTIDLNKYCYLELYLEVLSGFPQSVLEGIASFYRLENCFDNLSEITLDKVNYWRNEITSEEKQLVNEILGSYIERMGAKFKVLQLFRLLTSVVSEF